MQAHQQNRIDFVRPPEKNEGNFIAIIRLLAKNNPTLNKHLTVGPKNARNIATSKTIQNEILEIAANQIRDFYRHCLEKCKHFSVIADEVTSHVKEILSVCLRFLEILDNDNFHVKANKHEVLLDFRFLERITGQSIAENILKCLETHGIDIQNCQGQAYDTTASMSSSDSGVQAHIKKRAPDAEFQGCCLHSLNLVICHSSQIQAVRNLFDTCQQAFLFFHNSPKRQCFLNTLFSVCAHLPRKLR